MCQSELAPCKDRVRCETHYDRDWINLSLFLFLFFFNRKAKFREMVGALFVS